MTKTRKTDFYGPFGDRAHGWSPALWLSEHRRSMGLGLLAGGLLGGAAALLLAGRRKTAAYHHRRPLTDYQQQQRRARGERGAGKGRFIRLIAGRR